MSTITETEQNENFVLPDPYEGCANTARIQSDIDYGDYMILRTLSPRRGLPVVTINCLIKGLCDELRHNGIRGFDPDQPDNLERFYAILRRRSAFRPDQPASVVNEHGGVDSVRQLPAQPADSAASPTGKGYKGRKRKEKGVKANTQT